MENAREIGELENELKIEREIELRERARDVRVLEVLNSESITPQLLNLAKKGVGDDKLSYVKSDDGSEFTDEN